MSQVPEYPLEMPHRLCVQARERGSDKWGEPRPATIEDFISAVKELPASQHQTVIRALDAIPVDVAEELKELLSLKELEEVVASLQHFAEQTAARIDHYRQRYPKRTGAVIDAEFPEVDE